MAVTIIPAPINATPAVRNQPPITDITPVILNTALFRPHARSESDVPIATIKVTNVVDSGNFSEVPRRYEGSGKYQIDRNPAADRTQPLIHYRLVSVETPVYPCPSP